MAVSKTRLVAEYAVSVALIGVTAVYLWAMLGPRPAPASSIPTPTQSLDIADAHLRGRDSARVVMVAFSDFQCPFCARYATTTQKELEKEYVETGRVRIAFRHNPLTNIHPLAVRAAEAAECAGRQHQFWQMHDRLFERQLELSESLLLDAGAALGLDAGQYRACMAGQVAPKVEADAALSGTLSVRSTPVFMVGRVEAAGTLKVMRVISGSVPLQEFRTALDEVIDEADQLALAR